ncbi:MAG TPA: hypothetical protein VEY91_05855, partial [Candidatus Limnocylindria bacterium]|nr:hypothetical protein [Candidatus Limnocylindria bacterium]
MPRFTRFGTLPSYALRGLIAFALALLTLHPSLPVRDASAAIRSDDVDRIGRPTLVAPADKAQMAETAVRFAYEVPSGWGKAQLIVSRRPFDPSGWTRIEAESDMKVAELANGIVSLADAGVALDSDTRLWWAIAVEEQGTGRLKVSEVRSFNAVRKFSNRVAPHPLLKEGRRGTLSPTDLLSAPRANGEAAGAAPRIRLAAGYDFAPSVQLPALPSDLASIQAPREESSQSGLRAYLVQFAAPPSAGEMAAIAKAGGSVFCYVPDQAYLVRMTEQGRAQLDAQAKPAWIGDYQPAYKLSPRLDRAQAQVMPFSTLLFPDADIAAVRATLTELGIEVFSQSDNGINKLLRFRAAGPELAKVA